jgi:hypothetical protein
MKTSIRLPSLLALVSLASCASTQSTMRSTMLARTRADDQDRNYVSVVETVAKRRGIQVIWVNPPDGRAVSVAQSR